MAQFELIDFDTPKQTDQPKSEGGKGGKLKKLFKKKPFLIACVIVVLLGLYAWYRNSQRASSASSTGGEVLIASGTGASDTYASSQSAYTEDMIYAMYDAFNSQLDTMQDVYDTTTENLTSQVISLSERVNTTESVVNKQSQTISKQQDIATMMSNSDKYHYSTSTEQQEALHNANSAIASKWGWTFDDASGYWLDENGDRLYQTVTQQQSTVETVGNRTASSGSSTGLSSTGNGKTSSKSSGSSSGSSSNSTASVISQMQANSQKWTQTSSESEKEALHNKNMSLAKSQGWTYNSESGTYHDSSGKRIY